MYKSISWRTSRWLLTVALLMIAHSVAAQKQFTLEDLNFGGKNYRNMTPQNRSLTWWGDKLVHVTDSACTLVDTSNGKEKPWFTLEQLCEWADASIPSLRGITMPYADKPLALVSTSQKRMLIDLRGQRVEWSQDRSKESQASEWHQKSRAVAFVDADNLFVRKADGSLMRLTTDGSRDIVYGPERAPQ